MPRSGINRQRVPPFKCEDHLVFRPMILEEAPDIFHHRDREEIHEEQCQTDGTGDQVEGQGLLVDVEPGRRDDERGQEEYGCTRQKRGGESQAEAQGITGTLLPRGLPDAVPGSLL